MNSSYRVLKLRSGEEIIAQIKGKDGNKLILNNPMLFKSTTQMNQFGQTQEIIFLADWLLSSSVKITKIPENFVLTSLSPSIDILRLYDIELKTKKNNMFHRGSSSRPPSNSSNFPKDFPKGNNHFFMHMMLPPDIVEELMEEGILNFDGLENDTESIESINEDMYTGDQKNDPDYGNRWTDWNPDPANEEYH